MDTTEDKSNSWRIPTFFHGDAVIWIVFFLLCTISIIEVYSATSTLSYKDGHYWAPVIKHSIYLFVGFLIAWLVHNIPCRWFKLYPLLFIPASWLLLIMVPFVGELVNGAHRTIPIFGIPVQPSELAKGAIVIAVAVILSVTQTPKGADRHAFKYILYITVPTLLLIAPENFSTAALLAIVVVVMMFIGHVPSVQLGKLFGVCSIIGALCLLGMMTFPDNMLDSMPMGHRMTTWKHRVSKFTSHTDSKTKEISPEDYDMTNNAQVANSNIAIATSNIIGKMPGNSVQRDFLFQAYSDFIYSIIIEELGLVGGAFVALLYIILFFRAGKIARQCERNFPAFLMMGLSLLIVVQAMVNMCVAVGLVPVTGQPLPLISRGGASTIVNCVYIGMMLSVSRFAKRREDPIPESPQNVVNEIEFQKDNGIS